MNQLQRYLKRIGISNLSKAEPTYAFLKELQYCHVTTIPYENLDIIHNIPISLENEKLYHKVVEQGRGGYCFELNGLLAWALTEIGFQVENYFARYLREESGIPVRRHRVLKVICDDGAFLCDVGIGQQAPRWPLRLEVGCVQEQFGERYQFLTDEVLGWVLFDWHNGEWRRFFSFNEDIQLDIDFIEPSFYCEKHPDSIFNKKEMLAIKTWDGRRTIDGKTYKEFIGNELSYIEEGISKERLTYLIKTKFNMKNWGE